MILILNEKATIPPFLKWQISKAAVSFTGGIRFPRSAKSDWSVAAVRLIRFKLPCVEFIVRCTISG